MKPIHPLGDALTSGAQRLTAFAWQTTIHHRSTIILGDIWKGHSVGIDQRLKELNIELPAPVRPIATYVRWVQTGNLMFISGTGPSSSAPNGKLGQDLTIEQGQAVAREVGLQIIATIKDALGGDLDRVARIVKVLGMVNATPDFADQPKVINGCSDLFVDVFGEKGRHTRSAVGMGSLPGGIAVEIECTIEVA